MRHDWQFAFVATGSGTTREEALADALASLRLHMDCGSIEPDREVMFDNDEDFPNG